MKNEDIPEGSHIWALVDSEAMVLIKIDNDFFGAGPWEVSFKYESLSNIQIIERPVLFKHTNNYWR